MKGFGMKKMKRMNPRFKTYLSFLILSLLAAGLNAFAATSAITSEEFRGLKVIDGSELKTEKNKVLLYFWATWCPDCKEKLHKDFVQMRLPADAELITVNTDKDVDRAKHYISKESLRWLVARDDNKMVSKALKVFSVPFWAVLERDGKGWKVIDAEAGGNQDRLKAAVGIN